MNTIIWIFLKRIKDNPRTILWYIQLIFYYFRWTDHFLKKYKEISLLSPQDTLKYIIDNNKSFIRFWDWDVQILLWMTNSWGRSIEKASPNIIKKLNNIFENKNVLIGLFPYIITPTDKVLKKQWKYFTYLWYRFFIQRKLKKAFVYWDSNIFRDENLKSKMLLNYLSGKKVIIITKNNKNIEKLNIWKEIIYIKVPSKNAFSKYDNIMGKIKTTIINKQLTKSNSIFLVSAWPAAKIIVHDINKLSFVAWDTWALFDDMYIHKINNEKN